MPPTVTIALTPAAQAVLARIATLPERALLAIKSAVDEQNQLTITHISKARLSGKGPFPPEQGKLGVRTGLLRGSLWSTPAEVSGQTVTATLGTNIAYAGVHEFGGTFLIKKKPGSVRLRTDAKGLLLRQVNGRLAVFARKTHKRAKEVAFSGSTYSVTYPERAPIRRGIADRADAYGAAISKKIVEAA